MADFIRSIMQNEINLICCPAICGFGLADHHLHSPDGTGQVAFRLPNASISFITSLAALPEAACREVTEVKELLNMLQNDSIRRGPLYSR